MTDEEVKHLKFDFSWITLMHTYNIIYQTKKNPQVILSALCLPDFVIQHSLSTYSLQI